MCSFFSRISETPQLSSKEDWTAVLKVSCLFDFKSMRSLAIDRLYPITTPVDKIVLARDYGMNEWLHNAYSDVCTASSLPTQEDSISLGFDTYRMVAEAREALRPFKATTRRTSLPSVIQRVFSLSHSEVAVELIPESMPEVYAEPAPVPELQPVAPVPVEDDWASGLGAKAKKAKVTKRAASTFQWEEPEAAPAPAPIPEEPPRSPSPPPETVVEEPKAEDNWLAPVSAKKPINKPKKNQPFTWGAEESEEAPIVPADPEAVAAAPDDWFGGSTVAGKGKKGDELFGSTTGGKKGADMFSFGNPVTEPVVVAPAMSEAATSPAATEEAGADDRFGDGAAKKGKKASPFPWEEPALEAMPEPEPVAPVTTIPEIKEEEVIPGGLDDVPRGFSGSSAFGPTAAQVPRNPSANSASGQEVGGWGLGKVTKKAGGIFAWGGGWSTDQAEEPMIPAQEQTSLPLPSLSTQLYVSEPQPVVQPRVSTWAPIATPTSSPLPSPAPEPESVPVVWLVGDEPPVPAPAPAAAPADDWGLPIMTSKKKLKKSKK
jgi:hypothetical protein